MHQHSSGRGPAPSRPPVRPSGPVARPSTTRSGPRVLVLGALGLAVPHLLTAAFASLPSVVDLPGPASVPLAAGAVLTVQAIGLLLARETESLILRRIWLVLLVTTAVLLPLVALQAALSRVPFVSLGRGSAGALIWATVAVALALVGLVLLCALLAADAPEQSSLLFVPAAVLVPAVLGAPGGLDERSALAALAEAAIIGAVVVALGGLLPRGAHPLAAPVALGMQFVALSVLGARPAFGDGRGAVVVVCAGALLLLTVFGAVLVPLTSLATRRFAHALAASGPTASDRS